jgi:ABC-type branched-subunit amino acid transport system substrate-binding protein
MAYFKDVGWTRVGVLYINDAWGSMLAADLAAAFSAREGWELQQQPFHDGSIREMHIGLQHLKSAKFKVFLYLGFEADTILALREASKLGLIGKDYAWTFGDVVCVVFLILSV